MRMRGQGTSVRTRLKSDLCEPHPLGAGPPARRDPTGGYADRMPNATGHHGLKCPRCGYDLTGRSRDVCPECGVAFDPNYLGSSTYLANRYRPLRMAVWAAVTFALVLGFTWVVGAIAGEYLGCVLIGLGCLALLAWAARAAHPSE